MQALEKYGFFKGSYLGIRRLLRCHPWNPGGYDRPFLWRLYWKGTTKAGAWAGALSGITVVIGMTVYHTAVADFQTAKSMAPQFGVAAMIVSLITIPLVSIFTRKFDDKHLYECFDKELE